MLLNTIQYVCLIGSESTGELSVMNRLVSDIGSNHKINAKHDRYRVVNYISAFIARQ